MGTACVVVPRERGERARTAIDDAGHLDRGHEIVADDGRLYLPVSDAEAAAAAVRGTVDDAPVRTAERDLPERDRRTHPDDLLPFEPTYERLGDLVLLEEPPERAERAAEAIVASDLPARAVLNRASKVRGRERVREWDVLAIAEAGSRPPTETVHREYGRTFVVDVARAYFSPRLATERQRVAEATTAGEAAVDMFAGVGPFSVALADSGADVVAADVNSDAVELLIENAARNGVADQITAVERDARDLVPEFAGTADRIVMNLPHSADAFLDTAVALARDGCTVHYYGFGPEDAPFKEGARSIRETATDAGVGIDVVEQRVVRSYAPGEVNVVVDARLHTG